MINQKQIILDVIEEYEFWFKLIIKEFSALSDNLTIILITKLESNNFNIKIKYIQTYISGKPLFAERVLWYWEEKINKLNDLKFLL